MKLYLSHASDFDYQTELYKTLKAGMPADLEVYYPHDLENDGKHSKDIIEKCDIVLAEVSRPSTGQGIELGWADDLNVPIICVHKSSERPSGALQHIAGAIISYEDERDLLEKLEKHLK